MLRLSYAKRLSDFIHRGLCDLSGRAGERHRGRVSTARKKQRCLVSVVKGVFGSFFGQRGAGKSIHARLP